MAHTENSLNLLTFNKIPTMVKHLFVKERGQGREKVELVGNPKRFRQLAYSGTIHNCLGRILVTDQDQIIFVKQGGIREEDWPDLLPIETEQGSVVPGIFMSDIGWASLDIDEWLNAYLA